MGRLSKSVFLVILLLLSGISGSATHLCAMSSGSHAHSCCMGHATQDASLYGMAHTQSADATCCTNVPSGSMTVPTVLPTGGIHDEMYGTQVLISATMDQHVATGRLNRGAPHLAELRHSPIHALLCTFLV